MKIKLKTILLLLWFIGMALRVDAINVKYGMSFNSHLFPATQRSSLLLDNGESFPVRDGLTLSFSMLIRESEPNFGAILHLTTDDGQVIHFSNVIDNDKSMPALIYNDGIVNCRAKIVPEKWQKVTFKFDVKKNKIELDYGGAQSSYTIPMNGTKGLKIKFGRGDANYVSDVAPILLKDIKVYEGDKLVRYWKLSKHNADICLDEEAGKPAKAANPVWIIDNHVQWRSLFHKKYNGLLAVAFNPHQMVFYLCNEGKIFTLNRQGSIIKQQKVQGGYPVNTKSNGFVAFDSRHNQLMSFSFSTRAVSYFSFDQSRWSVNQADNVDASFYNHAGAYNPADSSYYFFGGYGYYKYHNELFRVRLGSNQVERVQYANPIPPRFGAAMGVADGKLYIFGGRGNKQGIQAVESNFYYELWSIDLKTLKAKMVWRRNSFPAGSLMATTMFYQPESKAFYAMNMSDRGGTMYQININDTIVKDVSKPVENNLRFQDFEFNMFNSPKDGHLYLVIDKILVDKTHDLSIYQLCTPLLSEAEISQADMDSGGRAAYIIIGVVMIVLIFGGGAVFVVKKRKGAKPKVVVPVSAQPKTPVEVSSTSAESAVQEASDEEVLEEDKQEMEQQERVKYYDRTKAAISLLGQFSVYDKEGNNITDQFTPRLKELFLLLVLYSDKKKHGVSVEKVTEIIWFDKKESAARNNRNVTLRKLRVLLESVGNVEIVSSNGYLSVRWGKDIFCDYHTIINYLKAYNEGAAFESDEELSRILEILLYGPLLQGYETEWLDDFKDDYSSFSLDLLNKLLRQMTEEKNERMVLCIADIMFLHDPLNEEALDAKCQTLCRQGKMGLAKRTYERFCKVYQESLGEDYDKSFSSFVK